mgnify:CR=1 FL=1
MKIVTFNLRTDVKVDGENFEIDGEYPYRNLRGDDIPENLKVVLLEDVLNYLQNNGDFTYIIEIKDKGENGFKAADELYRILKEKNLEFQQQLKLLNTIQTET